MEHAVSACSVQYKANGQLGELLGFWIFLSQSLRDGCKWCTETVDSVWGCVPRGSRSWNLQKAKENEQDWCVFFLVFMLNSSTCFTDQIDDQTVHRSSRVNKGSSGQITQLQNIERMQVERMAPKASHASQLEISTVNEPLNPMALTKPKPRIKTSSACVREDINSVRNPFHPYGSTYWQ